MASVVKRAGSRGLTYHVRWRENGRNYSQRCATPKQARDLKALIDVYGRYPEDLAAAPLEAPTFAEWAEHHIGLLTGVSERTRDDYRRQVAHHFDTFAGLPLDGITRDLVRRWVLERPVSGKTLKNLHGLLHGIMAGAVEAGHLSTNPATGLRLPRNDDHERAEPQFLTRDEFWEIADEIPDHWRPYFVTLVGTGLRLGELMALTVGDVDMNAATPVVRVSKSLRYTRGQGFNIGPTKTRKSRRTVSLDPTAVEMLWPLMDRPNSEPLVIQPNGKPMYPTNLYARIWRPAVLRAQRCTDHAKSKDPCGCDGTLTKNPRIHDLRHTHASWLLADGLPITVVQARLGHEQITTTVDRYGHLMPDLHVQAAAATARALARPVRALEG